MKKKDIILATISIFVVIISVFQILRMMNPAKPKVQEKTEAEKISSQFTGEIDDDLLEKVEKSTDYGQPEPQEIYRQNPFAPL